MYPTKKRMQEAIEQDLVHFPDDETNVPCSKTYLKDTEYQAPNSVIYQDGRAATKRLRSIIGNSGFKNPKDETVIESLINPITSDGDYIADFYAGSGTTIHSALNMTERGKVSKFIACEMGEYFDSILKPRVKRVCYASKWKNLSPSVTSIRKQGCLVKVIKLEQYEDLLDNLQPVWDENELPNQVPVRYLFRPEQNNLSSTLDLSRPFEQKIQVGKDREQKLIDLMETWCYLQGYWVKSRRIFRRGTLNGLGRDYSAVETTHGTLVLFRDIDVAEDDTDDIKRVLAEYQGEEGMTNIERLEINMEVDRRRLNIDVQLVSADDFMRGTQWS